MFLNPKKLLNSLREIFSKNQDNEELFSRVEIANPWFTIDNCRLAFKSWENSLAENKIDEWLKRENIAEQIPFSEKKVGLILAGNLPLVGLHDIICSLILGHKIIVKPSSQDTVFVKWILNEITNAIPEIKDNIEISDSFVKNADAYIGTGSNSSSRYFEYYFRNKPNLIRKNRTAVAIIDNETSKEQLSLLADDVFSYFGMGCRNVTHLFLPKDFDFATLFTAFEKYKDIINHNKYANNYTYHKAILLMNLDKHKDNGFLILAEREQLTSPVAMLTYSFYTDINDVLKTINKESENIQCVVSSLINQGKNFVNFGEAQKPELWDYADGVNTIEFLSSF